MSAPLKVGDIVRVTRRNRVPGYSPGDKGWVAAGPKFLPGRAVPYYLVAMERDGWSRTVPFDEGEIVAADKDCPWEYRLMMSEGDFHKWKALQGAANDTMLRAADHLESGDAARWNQLYKDAVAKQEIANKFLESASRNLSQPKPPAKKAKKRKE
jgi:hypothetical protein